MRVQQLLLNLFILSDMISAKDSDQWIVEMFQNISSKPSLRPKGKKRSQGSQDYQLQTIFHHIGMTNKYFVEFGFNEPSYTSGGSGANTWKLYEEGWRYIFSILICLINIFS